MVLESLSLRTAVVEARPLRGDASWWHFIRHTKVPGSRWCCWRIWARCVGLVIAFAAVLLSATTGDGRWDGAGSVAIGMLLGVIATVLALEMRSLLIGESASEADEESIVAAIERSPGVERLVHLRTQHLAPDELLVGLARDLTVEGLAEAIDELERRVREVVPEARPMYIEPDIFRDPAVAGADPQTSA
jgi:divalent metal cation (Fe/Co/Zn/Cd) transporter